MQVQLQRQHCNCTRSSAAAANASLYIHLYGSLVPQVRVHADLCTHTHTHLERRRYICTRAVRYKPTEKAERRELRPGREREKTNTLSRLRPSTSRSGPAHARACIYICVCASRSRKKKLGARSLRRKGRLDGDDDGGSLLHERQRGGRDSPVYSREGAREI